MAKMIMVHPDRCVGCKSCVAACAFEHEGSQRAEASRVHVYKFQWEGVSVPMLCQHCSDAACVTVCPTGAMHRNPETAEIEYDASRCIRCRMCSMACPFGNCVYDALTDSILKCNLCEGDPACVKVCPSDALEYVEDTKSTTSRQQNFASRMKDAVQDYPG
jgi:anaerobic carbon-monoxide dehydrogenase iron sulfur subunit